MTEGGRTRAKLLERAGKFVDTASFEEVGVAAAVGWSSDGDWIAVSDRAGAESREDGKLLMEFELTTFGTTETFD